ncbi:hypothetical protein ACIQMJ_34630 [Actinosynnema sp. NPDC091369]
MTTPEDDRVFTPFAPPASTSPDPTPPDPTPSALTPSAFTPPNGVPLAHDPAPAAGAAPSPEPPGPPSRTPIVVLTAVAAVLAVVAGLFTVLYLGERTDRDATAAARADRERTLADVTAKQDEADSALETNRSRESVLEGEHDLLTECADAAKAYFDLPPEQTPESSRLFRIMYDVCPQI